MEISDAYEYPYVNRLNAKDIKDCIDSDEKLANLFN